jgi:hypothetical protein
VEVFRIGSLRPHLIENTLAKSVFANLGVSRPTSGTQRGYNDKQA